MEKQFAGSNLMMISDSVILRNVQLWGQNQFDIPSDPLKLLSSLSSNRTCSVQAQNLLVNQERTQATESVKGEEGPLEHWCGKIMLLLMKFNYSTTHANLLL